MALFGKYTFRASPARGVGGVYATGQNEVDAPVLTAAQVPEVFGRQIWEIIAVNGGDDTYVINLWTNGSTFGGAFAPQNREGSPVGPVITSQTPQEWVIVPVETEVPDSYQISVRTDLIGVQNIVGTHGKEVVVRAFPVVEYPEEKPYWVLRKVSD